MVFCVCVDFLKLNLKHEFRLRGEYLLSQEQDWLEEIENVIRVEKIGEMGQWCQDGTTRAKRCILGRWAGKCVGGLKFPPPQDSPA